MLFSKVAFPKLFLLTDPYWFRKITTYPHTLAGVNVECPDDGYPKLKICISELILDSHEYIQVAYATRPCMI